MLKQRLGPIFHNIRTNWKHARKKIQVYLLLSTFIFLFFIAYFFNYIFVSVYPGELGVYWSRFSGTDMNYTYAEGLHIICPWNKMFIYDTRVQNNDFMFEALSQDGLPIIFEISVRYYPERDKLPQLHVSVGPNYAQKVVEPEVQANLRKVVANYIPEEIYTSEGYLLQVIMQGALVALSERHIILDNLLIRRMVLPSRIRNAIESKLAQEQISLEYEFRLERETKEAERKKTEAQGILDFQETVKKGNFFEEYLRFKGIEATLELSRSNNAKVILIGGGNNQLPLIMNMDSTQQQQANGSQSKEPDQPDIYPNTPDEKPMNDRPESSSFSQPLPTLPPENTPAAQPTKEPEPAAPNAHEEMHGYIDGNIDIRKFSQYMQSPLFNANLGKFTAIQPSVRESGMPYSNPSPVQPKTISPRPFSNSIPSTTVESITSAVLKSSENRVIPPQSKGNNQENPQPSSVTKNRTGSAGMESQKQ